VNTIVRSCGGSDPWVSENGSKRSRDMAEIIRRFEEMRRDGKFRQARSP
jgi:hypothetical protein